MNEAHLSCPVPLSKYPNIVLAHGGGGNLTNQLITNVFMPAFANPALAQQHDGAVVHIGTQRLAFTTDTYVVRPLFFPGGDIGVLAVNGTVNDLAMCGAQPLFLSAAFIIEEGLPLATLQRIVESMRLAADAAGVQLVTGDTKVVERGKGDGLYLNTAGIGRLDHELTIAPTQVRDGDIIILSGDVGRHGIAVMSVREQLAFETPLASDCAALTELVFGLLEEHIEVHCLRDLTRGGLATALVEIARAAEMLIHVEEKAIAVCEEVRGACEILGLDPLYVANEGRMIAFVPAEQADRALQLLRRHPLGRNAEQIGRVALGAPGLVTITSSIGARRILDMLSGEQLPRIC